MLNFVDELINKKKSVDPISVIQKSAVEKPTNNPCNDLPTCDVAGQDVIRPSQAEIVKPNFPSKSTETKYFYARGATKQRQRCRLYCNQSDRLSDRSDRLS